MDQDQHLREKRKDTGPLMFLSLFLLLLAFFILLNALSTFEEAKSRRVIQSVASTFQTQVDRQTTREILISTLGPVPEPEEILDEVERLWITAIPVTEVTKLTEGQVMQFDLPVNDLFFGGNIEIRGDRNDLVKATAMALAARLEGSASELQFIIGVEDLGKVKTTRPVVQPVRQAAEREAPPPEEGLFDIFDLSDNDPAVIAGTRDDRNLSFARAANFARAVVDAGAPPSGVSIGLLRGETNHIRIRFYIHPVDEAFNRFLDVEE